MRSLWSVALVVLLWATKAQSQVCPFYPPPYHDIPKDCSPYVMGDPVTIHSTGAYSWHRPVDIRIPTPVGGFEFRRIFTNAVSSTNSFWWLSGGARDFLLNGATPPPFGHAGTPTGALWWHSLFSAAYNVKDGTYLIAYFQLPNGGRLTFRGCETDAGISSALGCPGWRPHDPESPGEKARLWEEPDGGGLDLFLEDGRRLRYGAPFVQPDAGTSVQVFLSAEFTREGRELYRVTYASSGEACSGVAGAPYVRLVSIAGGAQLKFDYAMRSGLGGSECVLEKIWERASPSSSWRAIVDYAYTGGNAGLLASATQLTSGGDRTESYSYDGGFFVESAGSVLIAHSGAASADFITTVRDLTSWSSLCVNGNCFSPTPTTNANPPFSRCIGTGHERSVTWLAAGRGDGTDAGAGFTRSSQFGAGRSKTIHTSLFHQYLDSCTEVGSCSPGVFRWEHEAASNAFNGNCDDATSGFVNGASPIQSIKDKRNSWTVYPFIWKSDAGTSNKESPLYAFETTSQLNGATNMDGGSALEQFNFAYGYSGGHQHASSEWWPSALPSGSDTTAVLARSFETLTTTSGAVIPDRRVSSVLTGNTAELDGGVTRVSRGAFSRTTSTCLTQPSGNPHGLTLRLEGPCTLSSPTATSCIAPYPVTEYRRDVDGRITGRLKTDSNCNNQEFEEFGTFTDLGLPTVYTNPNGAQFILTYSGRLVTSFQGPTGTWSFVYDNNRLTAVTSPDGDSEVYCYRTGSSSCTGTYTDQLQWIALAPASDGTGWAERVRFDYWPDGNIRQASFESPSEVRRIERFAFDAHKRLTLREWGAGAVKQWSAYDAADNLAAVSRAGSSPPAFCLSNPASWDAGYSPLCSQLASDRANRLAVFDQFADDGGVRQCIDHDALGNTTRISSACQVTDNCAINTLNGLSTCGTSTDYQTDDFNFIVSRVLPDSDNGAGGRGTERRVFGPLGLGMFQSQAMKQNGRFLFFGRDTRGRPTSIQSCTAPSSCVTTHSLTWDSATPPSGCPTMSNRTGRIAKATDPVRQTWFSYDAEGRLTRELYLPLGAPSCAGSLSTVYTYTSGGKLSTLQYPHGRLVKYNYSSSGRVTSIDVQYDGVYQRTIDGISWEPLGGLRKYDYVPPGGSEQVRVENLLGDAAANDSCATATGTNDQTGRVRALVVTRKVAGTVIMKRQYRWTAEDVVSETICYAGGADITTAYTTDQLGRLTSATGTNFPDAGGPVKALTYEYDRLGNRTRVSSGSDQLVVTNTSSHGNWISSQASPDAGSKVGYWFHADGGTNLDGYVGIKSTASDSLNAPGTEFVFGWGEASSPVSVSGMSTVVSSFTRRQGAYSQVWNYHHDAAKRRTQTTGPFGVTAEFYWGSEGLLEEVGPMFYSGSQNTIDEYIWLDGSPVLLVRGKLDPTTQVHVGDFAVDCDRNYEPAKCQAYGLVTDRLGRPVLSLDHATEVTGVGEYDPFGQLNRVMEHVESAHPYPATVSTTNWVSSAPQQTQGLALQLRLHFNTFDTESIRIRTPSFSSSDNLYILNSTGATVQNLAGLKGDTRSDWYSTADGTVRLQFVTNDRNCLAATQCAAGANQRAYAGFSMDGYEYRRYSSSSQPFFPPYRGYGQYYDSETDQVQNWHRQLDPTGGRYLSPEPLLESPAFPISMMESGLSAPTYSYAGNNPVRFFDPDGLRYVSDNPTALWHVRRLREDRFIGKFIREIDDNPNFIVKIDTDVPDIAHLQARFVPKYENGRCVGGTIQIAPFREMMKWRDRAVFQSSERPLGWNWFTIISHESGHAYADLVGHAGGFPLYFENFQRPIDRQRYETWHSD